MYNSYFIKVADRKPKHRGRKFLCIFLMLLAAGFALYFADSKYSKFMAPPTARLAQGSYYAELPPDSHHIYIQLPLDHNNPSYGTFTDFYILSPDFKPGANVIFQLYDNQQETVGMVAERKDFKIFDQRVGENMSYVLIGNRGVSPTLFPEVFNKDGSPDYAKALNFYGSNQQIEDIEAVRKDMQKRGLLPKNGKIMLYAGSGGGVLAQQYLDKYGENVSRALVESTGAMDLSEKNNMTFARSLYSSNRTVAEKYYNLYPKIKNDTSLAWILFKLGLEGNTQAQIDILDGKYKGFNVKDKLVYVKNWLKFSQNYPIISMIFRSPQELEVKVRMWEVTGSDLVKYNPKSEKEIIPMYEALRFFLKDFLTAYKEGKIRTFKCSLNRQKFKGEIMVWANMGDQDFGPQIARLISQSYPHSRLAVFKEKYHHVLDKSEFQLKFTKDFYETGLYSAETNNDFNSLNK